MAFVLKRSGSYSWPVNFDVPVDGGRHERQTFDCEFKHLSQTRIQEITDGIGKDDLSALEVASEVLVGWSGVTDDEGKEVPFSQKSMAELLEVPMLAGAIVMAYFESLNGAKRKN